jgi:alpha-tubulin suppressor-like RCC1 family protein
MSHYQRSARFKSVFLGVLLIGSLLPSGQARADANEVPTSSANRNAQLTLGVGSDFTCVVNSSGGLKCWGYNGFGTLGDGSTTDASSPVDVVGLTSGVTGVSAGGSHVCAITTSGGAKCWGYNN